MILRLKWLSIPNFYAVQRGKPRSFMAVSDGVINLHLYINIHTDSGRSPETIFGCSLCKTHTWNTLFCSIPCKNSKHKRTKQEKAYYEVSTLFIWQKSDSARFFQAVIIVSIHGIIYQWKVQPFFYLKQFFLNFIQHREEVLICFLKPSNKNVSDFPSLVIWGEHLWRGLAIYGPIHTHLRCRLK